MLRENGVAPRLCDSWLCVRILQEHLNAPSMLAIFPLQDWLSISAKLRHVSPREERINDPSNPKHHWRYRMHLNIEDLLENRELSDQIIKMIEKGGR
jgi:4-alpha-glucanotransferase